MRTVPSILHADLDAFYASVEQLLDPSLRGRPIAVGGGVVLAASYEARAFGVRAGMGGRDALRRCPGLLFVGGHFSEYTRLSSLVMAAFHDVTPLVEQISIDEAFLDVGGASRLLGSPHRIAVELRSRVRDEIGLPLSVGAATTKHLAKVASQVAKPDGLVVVPAGGEEQFLAPLPVALVWGVGPVTEAKLLGRGITTIGQLAQSDPGQVRHLFGRVNGATLHARANNDDVRRVRATARARSVGAQSAFGRRVATPELIRSTLAHLVDRVTRRMRAASLAGRTLTVRIRYAGMGAITRARTMPTPLAATLTLTEVAVDMVRQALGSQVGVCEISLLGVSVSNLVRQAALQLELPVDDHHTSVPQRAGSRAGADRWSVDLAMDRVRTRFGRDAVTYLAIYRGRRDSVPDAFRELAEHEL